MRILLILAVLLGIANAICPQRLWDGNVQRQNEEERWTKSMTNEQKVQFMATVFDDATRAILDHGETEWRLPLHEHFTRFRAVTDFDNKYDQGRITQQVAARYSGSLINRDRLLRDLKRCKLHR